MRYLAILFATIVLISCNTTHNKHGQSQNQVSAPDSIVKYLLNAAATDFHTHRPPNPVRFRDVRISHITITGGKEQFMLCGEFLPDQAEGKTEWTPFVTIKTSGYEQYTGAQAEVFCQKSATVSNKVGDLASNLQSRLESLR